MRIAIRCDGSTDVGMGHISECAALARALRRQADCALSFLTQRDSQGAAALVEGGWDIIGLDHARDDSELSELGDVLEEHPRDLLIASLPGRNDAYYSRLRAMAPQLAAIFDDAASHDQADLIVDYHVSYGIGRPTVSQGDPIRLLGPEFALLDENYHSHWRRSTPVPKKCERIFVNQGGSDPFGLTPKILDALDLLELDQEVAVVMGPAATPDLVREVERTVSSVSYHCRLEKSVPPQAMLELMSRSDVAVTAAGNTLYELCALGIPSVVICHHERHDSVAREFERQGAAVNLGVGTALSVESIATEIGQVLSDFDGRKAMAERAKNLVDGRGCERVASHILAMRTGAQ